MNQNYDSLHNKLQRPVYPILAFFDSGEAVDYAAVKKYVMFLKKFGELPVMVTAGTSRVNLLTNEELKELNDVVTTAAHEGPNKQIAIAANPMVGSLAATIDVAKHAESIGADVLLIYYPERYYDDETVVEYYRAIAEKTSIPLMIHGMPMRNGRGGPPKPFDNTLCKKLAEIESVIGIKEESLNDSVRYKIARDLRNRFTIVVAGESMRMFLSSAPFGVQSYLVGVGSVRPELEERFFQDYSAGRLDDAVRVVDEVEGPFFDVAKPIGWHIALKAALAANGLVEDYERKPLEPVTDRERRQIVVVMKDLKLLNEGGGNE